MRKLTYKDSGVNIKKADEFVKGIKGFVSTNMPTGARAFGSPFTLVPYLAGCKEPVLVSSTDGVGTKLKIAIECGIHDTVGIDLVAMNVNDIICLGARPLFFLDYIACGKVKPGVLKDVVSGIHKGLRESDCCLIGGETAEMPGMYKKDDYDLAGFCTGIADKGGLIDGSNIKEGDVIVGLRSSGLHSNGFSLARKALGKEALGKYAKELLIPTRIYVKPVLALLKTLSLAGANNAVKGIAHITGGAFYSKAAKMVPQGIGLVINKNSWHVPDIFKIIQAKGKINEKEMYTVFNMGVGMLLVLDVRYLKIALGALSKFNNLRPFVAGRVVKSKEKIVLL